MLPEQNTAAARALPMAEPGSPAVQPSVLSTAEAANPAAQPSVLPTAEAASPATQLSTLPVTEPQSPVARLSTLPTAEPSSLAAQLGGLAETELATSGTKAGHAPPTCANCGASVPGKFCGRCGQRVEHEIHSVWHFTQEATEDLTHADSQIGRAHV